jgi:hypothetical protein
MSRAFGFWLLPVLLVKGRQPRSCFSLDINNQHNICQADPALTIVYELSTLGIIPNRGPMPSLLVRILLFISSYAPLLVISFFQWHNKLPHARYVFLAAAVMSVLTLSLYLRCAQKMAAQVVTIESSRSLNAEALNYIATYIIPFLDSRPEDWQYATGLAIFFTMLCIIYINSNMIHINPVLNVCGYRLLEVEIGGTICSLITRRRFLARETQINVRRLGDDILMEAA